MTRFIDGPAKGETFLIRRTPIFVRVTREGEKWDILNDQGDSPRKSETPFAYILTETPGMCCVRASKGRGGVFYSGVYRLCDPQPSEDIMRDQSEWENWVESNACMVPPELLK